MASGSDKRQRRRIQPVRCTADEFNAIAEKADRAGLSVAGYMRAAALGDPGPRAKRRPPVNHVALRQLLGQLGRVGNNLNQIAHALNLDTSPNIPELKDALRSYTKLRDAILEALGKKPESGP